jgi:hypothetical protein
MSCTSFESGQRRFGAQFSRLKERKQLFSRHHWRL